MAVRWDYLLTYDFDAVPKPENRHGDNLEDRLHDLGDSGWELAGVVPMPDGWLSPSHAFIFKRPRSWHPPCPSCKRRARKARLKAKQLALSEDRGLTPPPVAPTPNTGDPI